MTTAEVLAAIADEMNPGGRLSRSGAEEGGDQKQLVWQILDGLAQRKGLETARDLCVFLKAEGFVVWMLSHARRHAKKLEDAFARASTSARDSAEKQYREAARAREEAAFREAMGVAACEQTLSAARWLRAVQRGVGDAPVESAIGVIRRLLLELPHVLDRWERVRAARRALASEGERGPGETSAEQMDEATGSKPDDGPPQGVGQQEESGSSAGSGGEQEDSRGGRGVDAAEEEPASEAQAGCEESLTRSPEEEEEAGGSYGLLSPVLGAWENLVTRRLALAATAGPAEPTVIRVAGRPKALKAGDRVALAENQINGRDEQQELARLRARVKDDPSSKTKLKPRIKALKALAKETPAGTRLQLSADHPLRRGEVGTLMTVDGSAIPFLVKTACGKTWWYERGSIVEASGEGAGNDISHAAAGDTAGSKAEGCDGGRLADRLAPLVVCVLKRLPPESAEALLSFDSERAAAAIAGFLRSKPIRLGLDALRELAQAERLFNQTFQPACDTPSILGFISERDDLRVLFDASDNSPSAAGQFDVKSNLSCELPEPARVLDTVKGVVRELFDSRTADKGSLFGGKAVEGLAWAEERVCEVYRACSFQELAGGTSFLRFCAQRAREIDGLWAPGPSASAPALINQVARERLLEVARLAATAVGPSIRHDAVNPDMITVAIEHADLHHLRGVVERHFGVRLESLGFGSPEELFNYLADSAQCQAHSSLPVLVAQGLLWRGNRNGDDEGDGGSKEVRIGEAMAELQEAPFLVDLAEWMDWDNRYFNPLGPLADFMLGIVKAGGNVGGNAVLLEERFGRFIKLPARISYHDFGAALRELDAAAAAAIAVGLAADGGSVASLSARFQLLRAQVEDRLSSAASAQAARFVLSAAECTPPALRAALAVPLFIEPFLAAVAGAERALPAQCRTLAERAALRQVGLTTGRLAWIQRVRAPALQVDDSAIPKPETGIQMPAAVVNASRISDSISPAAIGVIQ